MDDTQTHRDEDFPLGCRLIYCGVTDEGCAALASALRSNPSHLRHLNLSKNKLGDSVKLLSDVLQNPHCKLETLWLRDCGVTDEGCAALASALRSNPSHLRQLDLSWNKLGDSVKLLSDVLQNPHCKLETLWTLSIETSVQFRQDQLMVNKEPLQRRHTINRY
ncbi:hypothetical protein Q8A67_014118 [Cirrhinus molitorella]|uniref:Uncharacterized protein n=1 Tax=Cirrhinus molitorella TaxID=172907 RepID=A0AA88PJS8_9TELE|nr:hypothetical protein Q8A67_014118 [Cirrhinus molitorella]